MSTKISNKNKQTKDIFAEIAANKTLDQDNNLEEQLPIELSSNILPLDNTRTFTPLKKLDTQEDLQNELKEYRENFSKYLVNLAPKLSTLRTTKIINKFDWRIETEEDRKNFTRVLSGNGKWEEVTIPHYGPPLGKAVTYYRSDFHLKTIDFKKDIFVTFKAVDYKAHIFLNGSFLGSHEGFFAPFEFNISNYAKEGINSLVVKVENDAICMGNNSWGDDGDKFEGDKIYAATGLGYDDPKVGWHHCPPGMGIYQDVNIETRNKLFIHSIFVRPLKDLEKVEVWTEIWNSDIIKSSAKLSISIFGQNFEDTVLTDLPCPMPETIGPGINYIRTRLDIPKAKIWELDSPWLYQIQLKLSDNKNNLLDTAYEQFGMRTFTIDENSTPKGRLYLNNKEIRLRGANTMGHLQQCVAKGNIKQLIDDILLAKICNMNFLRLTQRPVQSEIYEYCDRLGLMTQTDLPLFGWLRRNQFCEALRQTEEMEQLVRSHPCNIMVSLINEPFDQADKYHRHLARTELESFFIAAKETIKIQNPDRVVKSVDGDYCPPTEGLPDNHCYNGWYNGHGLDIGKLHKGYWQKIKPGWMYGCGEFGSEGLDFENIMRKYYPREWLPKSSEEESWSPKSIIKAQTGPFHYMWLQTQKSLSAWINASHKHQEWVTKLMTEAFRRDSRMNTIAIHLFIDAFPSGWMKTIMGVERQAKPAYFAYRNALKPLMISLRSDRSNFYPKENISVEAWICNDTHETPKTSIHYQLELAGKVIQSGACEASISECASKFQGRINFSAPNVDMRSTLTIRLGLVTQSGKVLDDTSLNIEVFPIQKSIEPVECYIIGNENKKAKKLINDLNYKAVDSIEKSSVIIIDSFDCYTKYRNEINEAVKDGAFAIFLELEPGSYDIDGNEVEIEKCGMDDFHFLSIDTAHKLVEVFHENDFKFWYNAELDYCSPIISSVFNINNKWTPILKTGNGKWGGEWEPALAVAEIKSEKGKWCICQLKLSGRTKGNPIADIFARRLIRPCTKRFLNSKKLFAEIF